MRVEFPHFSRYTWYCIGLNVAVVVFILVIIIGGRMVYQSYCQSRAMEVKKHQQMEKYQQLQEQVETQKEFVRRLSKDPELLEHTVRKNVQSVGENELLFRFE